MNCRRNASPYGFENLELASHSLVGPDAEYSNYVAAPLGVIQIIADIAPNNGCCFIYRYNDGITLEQYLAKRNYAEQLIALNQVMPQVIKGSIYLYNTDVTYTGLQRDEIIIQEDKKTGKLTAMLASAYQTFSFRQGTLKLNDKTTRANGANSQVLYNCNGFQKAYTLILKGFISVLFLQHPPNFSAEERIDIEAKVKRAANKKMHLRSVSDIVIKQATEAYIVFLKASYLANNGKDCSSLVATLQALYPESSA
ncbi:hypothetical protein BDF22DRAFT_776208 [Syncephalis plumigaleata]|nr:hypothetical protein BDF22DRAFT_776208 [Syncephalis plumigaleata]